MWSIYVTSVFSGKVYYDYSATCLNDSFNFDGFLLQCTESICRCCCRRQFLTLSFYICIKIHTHIPRYLFLFWRSFTHLFIIIITLSVSFSLSLFISLLLLLNTRKKWLHFFSSRIFIDCEKTEKKKKRKNYTKQNKKTNNKAKTNYFLF